MHHSGKCALALLMLMGVGVREILAEEVAAPAFSLAAAQANPEPQPGAKAAGETPAGPNQAQAEAVTSEKEKQTSVVATQPASQPAPPTDPVQAFIAKTKNPVPFFKWGADYRIRNEYSDNMFRFDKYAPGHEIDWLRHRQRIWATAYFEDKIEFNLRSCWEGRNIFKPESAQNFDWGEWLFDLFNVTLKKPFDLPITVVGGRQEIALGDRWLVFEGTPLDGSRTIYFDAIRVTTTLESIQTKIDTIYLEQNADADDWIPMLNSRDENTLTGNYERKLITEQREEGAIVWVENKSLKATEIDGYFIYKGDSKVAANGFNSDIYTFGTRGLHDLDEHWKAKGELAGQYGRHFDQSICALGSLDRLAYYFNDKHKNWLRLDYEYMSGDDPSTKGTYEAFDPLWGRWPRFSELLIYSAAAETRISDLSNMHRVALGHSVNILPKVEMLTDYHMLFADQNTYASRPMFTESGCFRGQLLTWWLKYVITPQLSGHVVAEYFFPGDYYANSNNDPATFIRTELVFTY